VSTPVSAGCLGRFFKCRYPTKSFDEFWAICWQYHSLHCYPLRLFMTMNDTSKVTLVESKACEALVVKEEPYEEEETNHLMGTWVPDLPSGER
jgi:hypothetical protein